MGGRQDNAADVQTSVSPFRALLGRPFCAKCGEKQSRRSISGREIGADASRGKGAASGRREMGPAALPGQELASGSERSRRNAQEKTFRLLRGEPKHHVSNQCAKKLCAAANYSVCPFASYSGKVVLSDSLETDTLIEISLAGRFEER